MSAIDYILTILILASLYLNWHLVQVCLLYTSDAADD